MNIKRQLEMNLGVADGIYLNDVEIDPLTIRAIMINEERYPITDKVQAYH